MNKYITFLFITIALSGNLIAMDQSDPEELSRQIHTAIIYGDDATAKTLLEQNISIAVITKRPLLIYAAEYGCKNIFELLLSHKANVNTRCCANGTALMTAAIKGHRDLCELLIAHNAQVDAKYHNGSTALMGAASFGRTDVCKFLIEHHAQVDARNHNGESPLTRAAIWHNEATAKFLIDVMICKQNNFQKNIKALGTFLGIRKKNSLLIMISRDMVRLIARIGFVIATRDNVIPLYEINNISNDVVELKAELIRYYETQSNVYKKI